jgi:hypothetical protein
MWEGVITTIWGTVKMLRYVGLVLRLRSVSLVLSVMSVWFPWVQLLSADRVTYSANVNMLVGATGDRYGRYWHSFELTTWSRVFPEKTAGPQLVKKLAAFYGTRRFITAFTSTRHLSLSRFISPIRASLPVSWRYVVILSSQVHLGLPSCLFHTVSPTKTLHAPLLSSMRATCTTHLLDLLIVPDIWHISSYLAPM